MAQRFPLLTFFLLAFGLTWPFMFAIALFAAPLELSFAAAFGPAVAAIIAHGWSGQGGPVFRWHSGLGRTLFGSVLCVGLTLLAFVALPAVLLSEDPRKLNWGVLVAASSYNWSTLLGGPLGEELGWRGYALLRLEERFGALRGSLLLGVVLACLHLPGFLSSAWPHPPFSLYSPMMISLTVFLSVGTNFARFAVIPAIAGHAAFNSTGFYMGGLFASEPMSARDVFREPFGNVLQWLGLGPLEMPNVILAACGITLALATVLITRGRLALRRSPLIASHRGHSHDAVAGAG